MTKFSWAGVRVNAGGEPLLIDALEGRNGEVQGRLGAEHPGLIEVAPGPVGVALLTHTQGSLRRGSAASSSGAGCHLGGARRISGRSERRTGLNGVTIGPLADAAGVSKGHLALLFGNREQLRLANPEAAVALFGRHVREPAAQAPTPAAALKQICLG